MSLPQNQHAASNNNNHTTLQFYAGLTLAGMASTILTVLFSLLHLQVFLDSYKLPLPVYSVGSTIFAMINTANDVAGAWLVDSCVGVTGKQRHQLVGISGCIFALCFLTPFFRFVPANNNLWSGLHFVTSLSLYDTLWSFHCILLSSIINDHSTMSDHHRINFMALGKVANLLVPMVVARVALLVFDVHNLRPLREFLLGIAVLVCVLSCISQKLVTPQITWCGMFGKDERKSEEENDPKEPLLQATSTTTTTTTTPKKPLHWKQVAKDFWNHPNFRYWICMEMLMEGQMTFVKSFSKTFYDHLLLQQTESEGGLSRATCDWWLSSMTMLSGILQLVLYLPIRRYGYAVCYQTVFVLNIILSLLLLGVVGGTSLDDNYLQHSNIILIFLIVYPTITSAMGSAGFSLAMADMVLELKHVFATQGRWDEPSLAGMFMGVNALFCKPTEAILPIVTATLLGSTSQYQHSDNNGMETNDTNIQTVLFRLLVLPPLICSLLQLWAWSHYNLHPTKTNEMREEWKVMVSESNDDGANGDIMDEEQPARTAGYNSEPVAPTSLDKSMRQRSVLEKSASSTITNKT